MAKAAEWKITEIRPEMTRGSETYGFVVKLERGKSDRQEVSVSASDLFDPRAFQIAVLAKKGVLLHPFTNQTVNRRFRSYLP